MTYGLDIETTGLMPWRDTITHISVVDAAGVPVPPEQLHTIPEGSPMVAWNAVFDVAHLHHAGIPVDRFRWLDAMLAYKWLKNSQRKEYSAAPYALETAAKHLAVDWRDWFIEFKKSKVFDATRAHYDAWAALLLWQQFTAELTEQQQRSLAIECEATIVPSAKAWVKGMPIDPGVVLDVHIELSYQRTALGESIGVPFKVLRSPDQLADLLYNEWGLPLQRMTPKGKPSTDKGALKELAEVDHRVATILKWRERNTLCTKFTMGLLDTIEQNGNVPLSRPQPRPFSTYTGRFTYSTSTGKKKADVRMGHALHQQPRGPRVRQFVVVPPGWYLVEFDAAGQEARLICDYSGDPMMAHVFNNGLKFHGMTGAALAGEDYETFIGKYTAHVESHSGPRGYYYCGKFVNLSCQYRIGAPTLALKAFIDYDMRIEAATADQWKTTYLQTYNHVPHYWGEAIARARMDGYAETRAGRRFYLTDWATHRWGTESSAINMPIQGTGADMKELAMLYMRKRHPWLQFAWDLHDGIFYWARQSECDEARLRETRDELAELDYQSAWGWTPRVPMTWDVSVSTTNWGEMREL